MKRQCQAITVNCLSWKQRIVTYSITSEGVDRVTSLHNVGREGGLSCGVGNSNIGMLKEDDRVVDDALEGSIGETVVVPPFCASCHSSGERGKSCNAEELHIEDLVDSKRGELVWSMIRL